MLRRIRKNQFDVVVIIRGEFYINKPIDFQNKQHDFYLRLKSIQGNAKFILYEWDSVRAFDFTPYLKYFDSIVTFDFQDSKDFNYIYHPLFYTDLYEKIAKENIKKDIGVFYLGSGHDYRYDMLIRMADFLKAHKISYNFNVLTKKVLDRSEINCFTTPRPFEMYYDYYSRAIAILDVSPPNQTGLSIRVIEAVGAKKKIITTSKWVKQERFYNKNNVFIWGEDDLDTLPSFLESRVDYAECADYSIASFMIDISNC